MLAAATPSPRAARAHALKNCFAVVFAGNRPLGPKVDDTAPERVERAPGRPRRAAPLGYAMLSPKAERELASAWQAGDRAAGERLVAAYVPFVKAIAARYARSGFALNDLVQDGNIGLLQGAKRFDPERGVRLATYAAYWIRAEIQASVARGSGVVRIGSTKRERRAIRLYRSTREADPAALAEMSGITEEHAAALLPLLTAPEISFDHAPAEKGYAPADRVADAAPSPEESLGVAEENVRLQTAMVALWVELSPREQVIVRERWLGDDPPTLDTLAASFGVSKERVRQIEERVRGRMRVRLGGVVSAKEATAA